MINFLKILVGIFALAASAQLSISIPEYSLVPKTAQSLVIFLIARHLTRTNSLICVLLYLLLGALGLPLFSNFSSGWDILMGKSAGYFTGFLFATLCIGLLSKINPAQFTFY